MSLLNSLPNTTFKIYQEINFPFVTFINNFIVKFEIRGNTKLIKSNCNYKITLILINQNKIYQLT
jgi:hypothetical protein